MSRQENMVLGEEWATGEWPSCINVTHKDKRDREVYSARVMRYVPVEDSLHEVVTVTNYERLFGTPEAAALSMRAIARFMYERLPFGGHRRGDVSDAICALMDDCDSCPVKGEVKGSIGPCGFSHQITAIELADWLTKEAK